MAIEFPAILCINAAAYKEHTKQGGLRSMIKFWRIAAYTFLAMSGMYAWLSIETGWRHYVGLGIFFLASVRIMILIFPKKNTEKNIAGADKGAGNQPD